MTANDSKIIGKRIKELMEMRGLNEGQLGGKVGLSQQAISNYIKGKVKNPPQRTLARIAEALDVSLHFLETGEGDEQPVLEKDEKPQMRILDFYYFRLQRDGEVLIVRAAIQQLTSSIVKHNQNVGPSQHMHRMLFGVQNLYYRLITRVHNPDELWKNKSSAKMFVEETIRHLITHEGKPDSDKIAEAMTRHADVLLQLEEYEEALRLAQEAFDMTYKPIRQAEALRIILKALVKLEEQEQDRFDTALSQAKTLLAKLSYYEHEYWCLERAYAVALASKNLKAGFSKLLNTAGVFDRLCETGFLKDHLLSALIYTHLAQLACQLGDTKHLDRAKEYAQKGKSYSEGRYNELEKLSKRILSSV